MKTKLILPTLTVITLLTSCSGSKFINRKYTSGRFIEHKSSIKHNTVFVDTTKLYASTSNVIELLKPSNSLETNTDKEIINTITNNILKKDSIFRIQRRGRDKLIIKKCDTKDVLIILNSHRKIIKIKKTETLGNVDSENHTDLNYSMNCLLIAKRAFKCASILWFLPLAGIILVARAIRKIKIAEAANPEYNFTKQKNTCRALLFLSLITTIAAIIGGFAYYINFIYVPMTAIY